MTISRRELLRNSALTGAALATGGVFTGFTVAPAGAAPTGGYGPLVVDPAGILDLPRGFQYRVLQRGGNATPDEVASNYDDGQKLAGDADGAASFAIGGGRTAIVTNHELRSGGSDASEAVPHTFHGNPVPAYNPAEVGGTSTIVLDPRNRVTSIYPSIAGTRNNCAGGLTPWGTWLTCEENTDEIDGIQHGYIFEVDATGEKTVAVPYTALGRMKHEAVAIDPATSVAYETEDHNEGLVYRFLPDDTSQTYGSLGQGGTLQAMKVAGLLRLGEVSTTGTTLDVSWVGVPGGNPDIEDLNQAWSDEQVTRSRKLEGIWWSNLDGRVYIVSSDENVSGIEHDGQVWAFDPAAQTIQLVAHIPEGHPMFDGPDNICIAPWGTAFLCEDGGGDQYLVGVDPQCGELWPFAFNRTGDSEFAGANFSPDGKTLFVNIQNPSMTVAISGPWGAVRHGM